VSNQGHDILIFTGVLSPEGSHAGHTLTVRFAGKPLPVEFDSVRVPHVDIPGTLEIEADPGVATHFPVKGTFRYEGKGKLVPQGATSSAHFGPARSASSDELAPGSTLPTSAVSMILFYSRLRDATDESVLVASQNKSPIFPKHGADLEALLRSGAGVNVLQDPPVAGGKVSFAVQTVTPTAELKIFELRADVPKMIGVLWPDGVQRKADTATRPVPYLVYFHPNTAQNLPDAYAGAYPFSHDFPYFQVIRYMLYGQAFETLDPNVQLDPLLHDPFWKGLAYQLTAAGKSLVIVKPVSKPGPEVGSMMDAGTMELVLREIGAFMFRAAGIHPNEAPPVGRVALASFSASTSLATLFLTKNAKHAFLKDKLQEIYSFDPPGTFRAGWFQAVGKWITDEKMARSYGQANDLASFQGLLGKGVTIPTTTPHFTSSASGKRTCASVPIKDWQAVTTMTVGFQEAHQLVPALLLTDALRRSGF
jgi:hypothetical protein